MRSLRTLVLVAGLLMIPATALAAEEVTVGDLIQMAAEFAGMEVVVEGELVGDYGFRDDGSMWTQINGDIYVQCPLREGCDPAGSNTGIGVRMPTELTEGLDPPGGYRFRGPVVRAVGIWKYHDPERQGESYLQVTSIDVVQPGRPLDQPVGWLAVGIGVALIATAALTWYLRRSDSS